MFLGNAEDIPAIIDRVHFSIFEFPADIDFPELPGAIIVSPGDKNNIAIEDIHDIEQLVRTKQSSPLIVAVHHAERMTPQAQNCFLKLLEEPGANIHFVFFVRNSNQLLPTIRSRAHVFYLKSSAKITTPPTANPETIALAKQYISATPRQLVTLSTSLARNRDQALDMLDVAIELLYKSYFKTGNPKFLGLLEKLDRTHENISRNGHVRLQLVAGMV